MLYVFKEGRKVKQVQRMQTGLVSNVKIYIPVEQVHMTNNNQRYCSAACQKKDWKKAHKHVCPVLAERINPLDKPCEQRTWQEYREDMVHISFSPCTLIQLWLFLLNVSSY